MRVRILVAKAFLLFIICFHYNGAIAQRSKDVYVDKEGVMRWGDSKKEVYGFGVNYTAPFAHAYRSAKKLNVDLKQAIDDDVYHFARLGLDAYRVHVWDTEISDSVGNLLNNEHLQLFDYLLMRLKERNIKIFLTPIAFWGNGYPERDDNTPGFASKYGKDSCLTNPDAIKAQERYLFQFLNHVNPYTKLAYKDDPDIVGFEVSNEPHHQGTPTEVIAYIKRMVSSMRKTGCKKPILYNISHSIHLSEAYFKAGIDGGTFQWYPTGLGARHELRGNFLPNVDLYDIPFRNEKGFKAGAKIVYEFDAADVGRSYIYPAMARSFREAGIQWATHFAYDPTFMAYANTEYNTHFMNLAYAPQKAISLKISSAVFHEIPRYSTFGRYPSNAKFGDFRVSYEEDLAEFVRKDKFYYTNTTATVPPSLNTLVEIAGAGSSPVVKYDGLGAYFLDKISEGEWRLEVMPDAVWVDNLFSTNSLSKKVAVINWKKWAMNVSLPDLGSDFKVVPLRDVQSQFAASNTSFDVTPGVYILIANGKAMSSKPSDRLGNIRIDEFVAPPSNVDKVYVVHTPAFVAKAGMPLDVKANVVAPSEVDSVQIVVQSGFRAKAFNMEQKAAYEYVARISGDDLKPGFVNYHIVVYSNGQATAFPSELNGYPQQWDFYGEAYTVPVSASNSLVLFNAATDAHEVSREWRRGANLLPTEIPGSAEMVVSIDGLGKLDPENKKGAIVNDYSLRYNFAPRAASRQKDLISFNKIVVYGKSNDKAFPLQIALIDSAGNTIGGKIQLARGQSRFELDIKQMQPVKMVTLPRPYPTFLPYYFERSNNAFEMAKVETVQVSVGPGLSNQELDSDYTFTIERITLE